MTNNEKIQRAEQLMAEANALLNEVKNTEDAIAKYKEDYCSRRYFLDSFSNIDMFGGIDWRNREHRSFNETPNPYQYYLTEELAKQAKELKDFNDKLLAFKYCYDLEYKPVFSGDYDNHAYFVYYDSEDGKYDYDWDSVCSRNIVYFSSREIAQKCANWLNSK